MKSETIVNELSQPCQGTHVSPFDCETQTVQANTNAWVKSMSGVNAGYVDAFSWALDKIENASTSSTDDDFIPCSECHFAAPRHADDCMAAAAGDFELMGKQHLMVQGLACQNGCKDMATERVPSESPNGLPIDILVCQNCVESLNDQWKEGGL